MQEIAISKFKATCLAVLEDVRRTGAPVRVTRFGRPVAEVVPARNGVLLVRVCERLRRNLWRHQRTCRSIQRLDRSEMRLLLDTHIWIWALHSPEKLGRRVRRELGRAGNELYLSPVSIWEAHHLVRRKRLRVRQGFAQWLDEVMAQVPLREAPFTFAVAADASKIELPQPDLGDIFLAATALVFDLTLVTTDSQLLACSWLKTFPNH